MFLLLGTKYLALPLNENNQLRTYWPQLNRGQYVHS
jgi:hypothetical protein